MQDRMKTAVATTALLLALPAVAWAQRTVPPRPSLDLGLRFTDVAGDEAKFQRFRDVGDGAFVERFRFDRTGRDWSFEFGADHVGRLDQRYSARYDARGKLKVAFTWDQVPMFISGDTRTLYTVDAPGVLRIADGIQKGIESGGMRLADFAGGARSFDARSRRDIARFGLTYSATQNLDVKLNVTSAGREGVMPYIASFGFSNAVEVPAPLDTRTTDVKAGIEWADRRGSLRVAYDGSWFDNDVQTLVWDNPLKFTDSTFSGAYSPGTAGAQGRYALWPNSTLHAVTTAGSLKTPAGGRLTGNVTIGRWLQDADLLPFTINTAIPAIPLARKSADAEARTLAMNYTYTARPNRHVWLNARYRYYDFDNRTPFFAVEDYVRLDQVANHYSHEGTKARSSTRRSIDLDASVTPTPFSAIKVGYGRESVDRTFRIFDQTVENTFRTSIDTTRTGWMTLRAIYERSERAGSGRPEEVLGNSQPTLRQFDVADRDRDRVTALLQMTPASAIGISLSLASGSDDYKNSGFGLRDNDNRSYNVAVDLTPADTVFAGVSYTKDKYTALQRSRRGGAGALFTDARRDWTIDSADRVHTINTNLDLVRLIPKVEARLSYDFTRSRAAYVYGLAPDSTIGPVQQLPTVLNERQTGIADVRYFLTPKFAVGVMYWYDRYRVEDFAFGPQTLDRIDLPGSLFLGWMYRPYKAHSAWLRLTYLW
jgi:MtrB/PioB family decaheme-associated outer membrane protein